MHAGSTRNTVLVQVDSWRRETRRTHWGFLQRSAQPYRLPHGFAMWQWRRSVVTYGGGQSQSSNCFRHLEILALPSTFVTILSYSKMWNLKSYPTTVLNESMWHFSGSKHTLTLLHIFRGQDPIDTRIYAPAIMWWFSSSSSSSSSSPWAHSCEVRTLWTLFLAWTLWTLTEIQ